MVHACLLTTFVNYPYFSLCYSFYVPQLKNLNITSYSNLNITSYFSFQDIFKGYVYNVCNCFLCVLEYKVC
jgi:hypothetical protein